MEHAHENTIAMKIDRSTLLIGSTYPLTLIRRKVSIAPQPIEALQEEIRSRPINSFWGHNNTLAAAEQLLGAGVKPNSERPAISLDADYYPCLDGECFRECWVMSPDYVQGFRPNIGEEVTTDKIIGWQILKITWE